MYRMSQPKGLEKAYDILIDRHAIFQMLRMFGIRGKLSKAVQPLYADIRVCVSEIVDASVFLSVFD